LANRIKLWRGVLMPFQQKFTRRFHDFALVGRVTPCAPLGRKQGSGAQRTARPTISISNGVFILVPPAVCAATFWRSAAAISPCRAAFP
jgi:hypothetical protein